MLLGYDLGSSSIKATLIRANTGEVVASATYPKQEMSMISKKPGWAEQKPDDWWTSIKNAILKGEYKGYWYLLSNARPGTR